MENLNTNTIHDLAQSFADDLNYQKEAENYQSLYDLIPADYNTVHTEISTDIFFKLRDYFAEFDVYEMPLDDDVDAITDKIIALMDISVEDD